MDSTLYLANALTDCQAIETMLGLAESLIFGAPFESLRAQNMHCQKALRSLIGNLLILNDTCECRSTQSSQSRKKNNGKLHDSVSA